MTTTSLSPDPVARHTPARSWIAVIAVAFGTFSIVTTEMLPVGLLSLIGPDIGVSAGASGQLMTVASTAAVVSALTVLSLAGRLDRRLVLAGLMALLLVSNVATALAGNFPLLLAARLLAGVAIGGFWATAASLAVRLVPEHAVARASSIIFSGVAVASVVGVPAGRFVGELAGWRGAFAGMAGLSLLVLLAVVTLVPRLPSSGGMRMRDFTVLLRRPQVLIGLASALLIVIGHFAAYTYVTPVLRDSVGIDGATIVILLLIYGVAGIAGTFAAGAIAGRRLREVVMGGAALIAVSTAAVALLGAGVVPAMIVLVVWGLGYGAVPVGLQVWVLRSAPDAPEGVSSLFTAGFQAAIGAGAVAGGMAVDTVAVDAPMLLGTVLAAAALLLVLATARRVLRDAA